MTSKRRDARPEVEILPYAPSRRRVPRPAEFAALMKPKPFLFDATERRLSRAASIADLRRIARRRAPKAVFDYTDGGAGAELSMSRARRAFERVEFRPRVLQDVSEVDTATDILGRESSLPLVLAPTGFTRTMHHEGERAVARAAGKAGIPYALSTMGTTAIEEISTAVPGGDHWFQLYLWKDREASAELIDRAWASNYTTLVLTVDTPVGGDRLRDVRNGMTIPPSLTLRTFLDGAARPWWWMNFLTTEPLNFASLTSWSGTVSELANKMFDPSATVADVEWLRGRWPGSLVVKGVQSVEDALIAVDAGADAVVLSNHGGRQLDRAPVALEHVADTREAIGDRAQVFIDGGVMSGSDIVAAVGMGAHAALVGRAYLYGLMAGGERGVDRVLGLFGSEVRRTMQLLGTASVKEITSERVRLRRE